MKFDDPPANARFCDAQHALDKVHTPPASHQAAIEQLNNSETVFI